MKKVRRKGSLYCYHRRTGKRIKAEYGTDAFIVEVLRLNAESLHAVPQPEDGTLGGVIAAYRASPEFQGLADRTKRDYQKVLDYLKPMTALSLERLTSKGIIQIRDKAFLSHRRRFANYVIQVIRILCSWGKPRGWLQHNPAADVPLIPRPRSMPKANRAWSDMELETVLGKAIGGLRLAILLGVCTGMREGDVLRFLWSGYDGQSIQARQAKTGTMVWLPVHHRLKVVLDSVERKHTTVVVGERGRPYTTNGFQSSFFKLIRKLEEAGNVQSGLTFHGLRHTVGKNLAEAGCGAMRDFG